MKNKHALFLKPTMSTPNLMAKQIQLEHHYNKLPTLSLSQLLQSQSQSKSKITNTQSNLCFSCDNLNDNNYNTNIQTIDKFIYSPKSSRVNLSNKMINKKIGSLVLCKIFNKKIVFNKPKNFKPKKILMPNLGKEIEKETTSNFNNKYNILLKKITRNSNSSFYAINNIQRMMVITNNFSLRNNHKEEIKCDFNFKLFDKAKKLKVNNLRQVSI